MTTYRNIVLAAALAVFAVGCDQPPAGPRTADGKEVKVVVVNPADAGEAVAVSNLQTATAAYKQALEILHAYYVRTGAYDKQLWTERESANLTEAQTFTFEGGEAPAIPPTRSAEDISEASAAEDALATRRNWQECLEKLGEFYSQKGLNFKLALVRNIQARFDPVHAYTYYLHVEIPPADLKPTEAIPAADELFVRALKLHQQGKPLPGVTDYPKQRKALGMLLRLIKKHPTSTKIAAAAYYIAEIYKEYFNEDLRAVKWYERAWQWDPNITLPARSQAAFIYDIRLGQHGKALPLYREAIKCEQYDWTRVRYARQRIEELTGAKD